MTTSYTPLVNEDLDQDYLPIYTNQSIEDSSIIEEPYKYVGKVAAAPINIRHNFIKKVYAILLFQIILTSVVSSLFVLNQSIRLWVQSNAWMVFVSFIGTIASLMITYWKRKSYPYNIFFLILFTLFESYSVGLISSFYNARIVIEALIITAVTFSGLTIFALQTKFDFTGWRTYLFGGLWLLIGVGMLSIFFPFTSQFELLYSGAAAVFFSIYIVVDTQMILKHYDYEEEIAASIALYLDIVNLFINILSILGSDADR